MAVNSNNVRVARTGEWYVGATTAAAPTGNTTVPAGFTALGALSEDGTTESASRSVDDLKMWQNGATARSLVTDSGLTFAFTMLETNATTVALAKGTVVTPGATFGTYTVDPSQTGGRRSFIFDVVDGAEIKRTYVPLGEVTEVDDITYASGEPIAYGVTITCYFDSGIGGYSRVFDSVLKT